MVTRIPYLETEIAEGWTIGSLTTVEDCDEAMLHLTREMASIDAQLEESDRETALGAPLTDDEADWARRARSARKVKEAVHNMVGRRRNDIERAARREMANGHNQRLLDTIKAIAPGAFADAVKAVAMTGNGQ